jgi:arginine decarboxylase
VLVRFTDILKHRLGEIHSAFQGAITQHQYQGGYSCVYPIKVNQQRQVVEEVLDFGRPYGFGLEAGSKPELLAVVALADNDTPIICNGFKDAEFIETAMLALKIGRNIIPVVEKLHRAGSDSRRRGEARRPAADRHARELASRGSGRWQSSGGFRSKFGLTVSEIIRGLEELKTTWACRTASSCCTSTSAARLRTSGSSKAPSTKRLVATPSWPSLGAGLQYLDVGGGLGVDYDGSQTNFESSMNYTLQEYANDVVYHIQTVCDEAGVPHPTIVSESGRAVVAYHSVLVFNVLGVSGFGDEKIPLAANPDWEQPLADLIETYNNVTARNALEAFHDAQQALDMALSLFNGGYLPLDQRSMAENLFWAICTRLQKIVQTMAEVPEELQNLDEQLSDTYFCNFSLFQSIPDSWAIKQLFPVMPIHRLNEKPLNHAVLGDITCDSDGKLDRFVDRRDVKKTLPLHTLNADDYYLGVFLVGGVPGDPGRPP